MNYWVVKGSVNDNDWDGMLVPGSIGSWWTSKFGNKLESGDRLFLWQSTPKCRVVGLGQILRPCIRRNGRRQWYSLRYLTGWLDWSPSIEHLRKLTSLREASFLKSGAATCIFPLTQSEAGVLFGTLQRHNQVITAIWPDLADRNGERIEQLPDVDLGSNEGARILREHLQRERDPKLVCRKKEQVKEKTKRLACECCEFDFEEFYGSRGKDLCEVHHLRPLGSSERRRRTKLNDLAIVCSNCHRVIHLAKPMLTVKRLRKIVRAKRGPKA